MRSSALDGLAPGAYEAQVIVVNASAQKGCFQRAPVAVQEAHRGRDRSPDRRYSFPLLADARSHDTALAAGLHSRAQRSDRIG